MPEPPLPPGLAKEVYPAPAPPPLPEFAIPAVEVIVEFAPSALAAAPFPPPATPKPIFAAP